MADGSKQTQPAKDYPGNSKSSDSVKYMQEVDTWFDDLFRRGEKKTGVDY
jgi:hypothetical protein